MNGQGKWVLAIGVVVLTAMSGCKAPDQNAGAPKSGGEPYANGWPLFDAPPFDEVKAKAEKGDVRAEAILGDMYLAGIHVAANAAEAAKWLEKAAKQGDFQSQETLGLMYEEGNGVPKDKAESEKWFRRAVHQLRKSAQQGDPGSQDILAFWYFEGRQVPKDLKEAKKWWGKLAEHLGKAAEQGDAKSQNNLAVMYREGRGVEKDYAEAYKWLSLAVQNYASAAEKREKRHDLSSDPVANWIMAKHVLPLEVEFRDKLAALMTPEQIEEGKRRAAAFVPKKEKHED